MSGIYWLVRCRVCGSVFQEHRCEGSDGNKSEASITYTQLALFEERDED